MMKRFLLAALILCTASPLLAQGFGDPFTLTLPATSFTVSGTIVAVDTLVGPGSVFVERYVEISNEIGVVAVACEAGLDCGRATLWLNCAVGIPIDTVFPHPSDPTITVHRQTCADPGAVGSCVAASGTLRDPVQGRVGLLANTVELSRSCA